MKKLWLLICLLSSAFTLCSCIDNNTPSLDGPSEDPTENLPTEKPTEGPTQNNPTEGPTQNVPTEEPTEGPTQNVPTEGPTQNVPTEGPTQNVPTEEPTEGPIVEPKKKVNVIVLAGQSNAVGQSYSYHFDEEDLVKYQNGFENVKIHYELNPFATTESIHINEGFETVKLGQGKGVDWSKYPDGCIGPELGIAEYLSMTYPDEEFYIIKTATGASTLHDRWFSSSSFEYLGVSDFESNSLYVKLLEVVDNSMELLREEYDPEIFSFCWMQGENDAKDYSSDYEILWSNFINDLKTEWTEKDYLTENGLSVIDAGITNYWTNFDKINAIKEKYAAMSSKNHYIEVVTDPLITAYKDNTDYAHLDVYAMLKLGQEFGKKISLSYNDLANAEEIYNVPHYENNKWDGITISQSLTGEGTLENPYLINSAADMAYFAESAKEYDYANKYVKLTTNLDMSNYAFKGIGYGDYTDKYEYVGFAGTFDGDGHTVKVNIVKDFVAGLFAAVSGTVKNVTVTGSVRCVYRAAGAIAGIQDNGLIENCTNSAIVSSKYYVKGNGNVGGIVGYQKNGDVKNCVNNGNVYGNVNLVTDNQGVGGIIGTIAQGATGTISGNINNGLVYNLGYCTGGIIGIIRGKCQILDCKNNGEVFSSKSLIGGIVGITNFSDNLIDGCTNTGYVKGATLVGGIIGALGFDGDRASKAINCTNEGLVEATATTHTFVVNSTNAVKAGSRVGGIAGMAYGSTVEICTNTGTVKSPSGTATEEYQTAEPFLGLIVGYKTSKAVLTNNNYSSNE